jgi:hypothetical protein
MEERYGGGKPSTSLQPGRKERVRERERERVQGTRSIFPEHVSDLLSLTRPQVILLFNPLISS